MTIAINHAFTSLKGDGGDATLVRPSNWNAAHTTSMASANLVGRLSAGMGVFEEIPISALMASALTSASGLAFLTALGLGAFETGDVKYSINPTPSAGWIAYQSTGGIGNAASGASTRANADTQALWELLYNQISDSYCTVSGGRTGNSTNDYNANKIIALPWFSGRAIVGAGAGGSLTTRTLGAYFGEENHTLSVGELASHYHYAPIYDPGHSHTASYGFTPSGPGVGGGGAFGSTISFNTGTSVTGVYVNGVALGYTAAQGGNGAHNNMQPSVPMWAKVKL